MGLTISEKEMVFTIPNSEAVKNVQRKTETLRTVGSYYLSGKADEAGVFLNNLEGYYYVDLYATFLYCKDFYQDLIKNCRNLYMFELFYLEQALKDIEWASRKNPSSLFFKTFAPIIIETRKYLKFPDVSTEMGVFRHMCVGELTELVIEKLSPNTFRIFVRPKKDALGVVSSSKSLLNWLTVEGFIYND